MIDHNPYAPPTANESPCLEHVLYWVWEREAIRIAKENEYQGELTRDPIMKQYRFCNVRRRDDRVSKWIIENMFQYADDDDADVWFVSAIARFINWPPTLRKLLAYGAVPIRAEDFDKALFCEVINQMATDGEKVWTGAYMIRAVEKDSDKKSFAVAKYLQSAIDNRDKIRESVASNSVAETVAALHECYGFGTFMAGQVAADLTYVQTFDDVNTWAPIGPGSKRGLNRLYGFPLNKNWKQVDFNLALIGVRKQISEKLQINDLSLHCVQNVMCETDKYLRVLYNEGRPKSTYTPETRF